MRFFSQQQYQYVLSLLYRIENDVSPPFMLISLVRKIDILHHNYSKQPWYDYFSECTQNKRFSSAGLAHHFFRALSFWVMTFSYGSYTQKRTTKTHNGALKYTEARDETSTTINKQLRMLSLKETIEQFLLAFNNYIISEEKFLLLYD